jgi:diguanylate cyclase (GGDEF)-like protein
MNDLKNSVAFLFLFVLIIFGIAQIDYVETNLINFSPAFFIMITLAVVSGILVMPSARFSIYAFLVIWTVIYGLTWVIYWRLVNPVIPLQVHGIQFLLIEIAAGLAFDIGRHINQVIHLVEGLTANTYPNRTLELHTSEHRISAELTRSRRYHHSLAVLLVQLDDFGREQQARDTMILERDILSRFAAAKIGQIISECARETDLIIRDDKGRFVVLCPETNSQSSMILADRISKSVSERMNARVMLGSSSFPDEALTFDELVSKASERMQLTVAKIDSQAAVAEKSTL